MDLGAGVGYLVRAMLDQVGPSGAVALVEPDARALSVVQSRWGDDPRVRLFLASAAEVPALPDASADRVVLSLVLCCMVDKAGALNETWRILRPGGLVLVSYPERRWRLHPRKASLRVTPGLWSHLVAQRPWRVVASERRRWVRRHLLEKPELGS